MERMVFSEEDIATLISLWEQGVTAKDIALSMGRPYNNIRNKVKALQKKGVLKTRDISNTLSSDFINTYAGMYQLPVDVVEKMSKLFSGGQDAVINGTQQACEAYATQNGFCYYLSDRVKLTFDDSPSSAVPMLGADNQLVLVCKAISHTRNSMGHNAFINVCKYIANKFE